MRSVITSSNVAPLCDLWRGPNNSIPIDKRDSRAGNSVVDSFVSAVESDYSIKLRTFLLSSLRQNKFEAYIIANSSAYTSGIGWDALRTSINGKVLAVVVEELRGKQFVEHLLRPEGYLGEIRHLFRRTLRSGGHYLRELHYRTCPPFAHRELLGLSIKSGFPSSKYFLRPVDCPRRHRFTPPHIFHQEYSPYYSVPQILLESLRRNPTQI